MEGFLSAALIRSSQREVKGLQFRGAARLDPARWRAVTVLVAGAQRGVRGWRDRGCRAPLTEGAERWPRPTPFSAGSTYRGPRGGQRTVRPRPGRHRGPAAAELSWRHPTTVLLGSNSVKTGVNGPAPSTSDRPSAPQPTSRVLRENGQPADLSLPSGLGSRP